MTDKVRNEATSFMTSVYEGAVEGDFSDNDSTVKVVTQVGVGLIPVVGQLADARDTVAAIQDVRNEREGAWTKLGFALVGWLPIVGDLFKPLRRSGVSDVLKGVDYSASVVRFGVEHVGPGTKRGASPSGVD
jgi:hypothetical protein